METLSPTLWDLTHWARTAGSGAAQLLPQSRPWVGARVASPHCSVLRPSEESVAEPDAAVQHWTNHLLIKPDILTCYQHSPPGSRCYHLDYDKGFRCTVFAFPSV